jgi:hypothetical protein
VAEGSDRGLAADIESAERVHAGLRAAIVGVMASLTESAIHSAGLEWEKFLRHLRTLRNTEREVAEILGWLHGLRGQGDPPAPAADRAEPATWFFNPGTLHRWATSSEVLESTDDGELGSITIRYTGRLKRAACPKCGEVTVAADDIEPWFCEACLNLLTPADVERTAKVRAGVAATNEGADR